MIGLRAGIQAAALAGSQTRRLPRRRQDPIAEGGDLGVVDEVIAGGTPRRSERVVRGAPTSAGGRATSNDNVTDIAA